MIAEAAARRGDFGRVGPASPESVGVNQNGNGNVSVSMCGRPPENSMAGARERRP